MGVRNDFEGVDGFSMYLHFMDNVRNVGVPDADLMVEPSRKEEDECLVEG